MGRAVNRGWNRRLTLLGAGLLSAIAMLSLASSAHAAPDIALDKQAPSSVLFGDDSRVTLHAANPSGQPYGYNLSFRDVLPAGVSYVPGSAPVEPQVIDDAPTTGETTLIFSNVTDLSPGSTYDLTYEVRHDTTQFTIGDTYTNDASTYINDDPRFVPDFDPDGTPSGDFTGSATDSATTDISAIEIEKSEPSPEGELLRGIHDHQTVYTLTVRNNAIEPTDGITVEDWLPAGLEYLACGTDDNTTEAPTNPGSAQEYPGSGPINPGNAPAAPECVQPDEVETVETDPDGAGPLPTGVYTHVVWDDLGNVAANGQLQVQYVAAVPIRENTTSWAGGLPAGVQQASNLDNNSGPETVDEQALTNYATAAGDFDGTLPVSDDHSLTRTAEDLRVLKSVDNGQINQGQISEWTLRINTSEYRYVNDVRVDDTVPDGLCPVGPSNFEGGGDQQAECDPTGDQPSADYTSVTESADGSYAIHWDDSTVPQLSRMQPSSEFEIIFPTRTRAHYQENFQDAGPVLAEDSWENHVEIAGADFRICAPDDPDCTGSGTAIDGDETDGTDDFDTSAAGQRAGGISIDKKVREANPTPVDCDTGNYVDGPAPNYGPGDTVCWELRIDFAALLDTGEPELADFLPPGTTYVPGSAAPTSNNTVSSTFSDADAVNGLLTWDLGTDVAEGDLVFEWRFATTVDLTPADSPGDVAGNLMKLAYANTPGQTFPLRDDVNFERSAAVLDLVKGVQDINGNPGGGNPPDTDGGNVAAGDVVTYRVDVSNNGDVDAADAEVWDDLEDGITCADVSNSDGGTCSGTRITWTGIDVAASATHTLTYDVTMPSGIEPGRTFDDHAGVVSYESATNTGGTFTYVPEDNIDPGAPAPNAPAADDTSFVQTRNLTFSKSRTTQVSEAGNAGSNQATIGERIHYANTIVVPEGTTLYGPPQFTDDLGARQTYVTPPDASATLNGGALPGGFTLDTTGNVVSLEFPTTYTNAAGSGDDTFEISFDAVVNDVAANSRVAPNQTLTNVADFAWQDEDTTPHNESRNVSTTIVEPDVGVTKDEDDPDDRVTPGQTLNYTVTASNPNGTRVSTAHDLELVDHVPAGLTPEEATISNGGVWDPGTRTITWTIDALAPGATANRTYSVTVDDPATAGEVFDNAVDLTATSMEGDVSGERGPGSPVTAGYVASAQDSVQLTDASLTKSVDPTSATIGEQVTYTTQVTFPANVTYFDATMFDALPDGLVFDTTLDVNCTPDPCDPSVTPLTPQPQPDGTTRMAWFLDDLPNISTARAYEITYAAHVADQYESDGTPVLGGDTLTNEAEALYNGSDEISGTPGSIPDPTSFTNGSGPDEADVAVVEPDVELDKDVSGDPDDDDVRNTQPGDSYTYSLKVHNAGDAPAYDVEVTDTPDAARLDNILVIDNPDANETDDDGTDGTLGWTIPGPIAPGATVTLEYTADLAPSAQLHNGDTVVNTADVPMFWGVPEGERDDNPGRDYREYTDVPPDTVTLDVNLPELDVSKTVGDGGESAVAEVGEPFAWRVTISNTSGAAVADSVHLSDVLPPNWEYVPDSASFNPGGPIEPEIDTDPSGDELSWENVGDLAPGGQIELAFEARPTVAAIDDPGTGASAPHLNDARATAVDSSGAGASGDGDYADEDGAQAVLEIPELTIDKTPDGADIDAGEGGTYTVQIANDGAVPARDVVVTDVLGPDQSYDPGTATADPSTGFSETSVSPGPGGATTIEWAIDEIPAGGSVTITLPIETDPSLSDDTELVNDASVVSREISTPESDEGSYLTNVDSDVGIDKQPQAGVVDAGEEMDFTLTVSNDGPSDATGVTVSDVLPANLEFVSAEDPCDESAGTVTCAIGNLEAGDSVELTLRVRVDPDETVEVSNTATVTSTTPDSNPDNNDSTATKPIGVDSNVRVQKDGPAAPVLQGSTFDYTIQVENAGVSAAADVTLTDDLPDQVQFVDVSTDVGTCDESGGTVQCAFGTLQPGENALVTVEVLAAEVGDAIVNTASATTPSNETTTDDNDDDAPVEIVPMADLGVTKTAPAEADPNSEISYDLEVTNNGPSAATGVNVTDTLPDGVELVSADPGCAEDAGIVTCTVGDLAVDETRGFTVTVLVPYALAGQELGNTVIVDGNEGDLNGTNDSDQATTAVGPAADLSITKTAGAATAGESAMWTLVVHNSGPSAADPVTVTDSLPAGTSLRSASPSQGDCGGTGREVECDLGALPAGGSAQIAIVADVAAGTAHQQLRNTATVAAPQPDPDPSNNDDEATRRVGEPAPAGPDLRLRKSASTETPQLGKRFSYRVEVSNVGDRAATGVRVVDTPSKSVKLKRAKASQGRCKRREGEVRCSLGTLGVGETAAVTLVVIPKSPGELRNTASASATNGGEVELGDNVDAADVRVLAPKASWKLSKRASRRTTRGGKTVRFAIVVRVGKHAISRAEVCDRLPGGLVFVRARGARFEDGRACWSVRYLGPRSKHKWHVVARAERGFHTRRVRNVGVADANNARRDTAAAKLRVKPAYGGAGGGVTG